MNPLNSAPQAYEFGPFRIDTGERLLLRDAQPVTLTPKTYELLLTLVRNAGRVVEKGELMQMVWPDTVVDENNLNQQISTLRKVLGEKPDEGRYIKTIPGRGYRFVAELGSTQSKTKLAIAPIVVAAVAALVLFGGLAWWRASHAHPRVRSVAVLPFRSLGRSGDEYLGLGMSDVLITRLSNVRSIAVRPTSAVRRYSAEQDPLAAGRALNVDSVLEGTVQHVNDRVRVTVRLLNVADGASMWGETFDEQFVDLFAVEDSVSERLARALALRLSDDELRRLTRRDTQNAEAHQWYLKGRYYATRWSADGFQKARESFDHAIAIDPTYALAYAGLADAYYYATTLFITPAEGVPRARAAAMTALRLDDSVGEAHAALGMIRFRYDWDFAGAEHEFRRAIQLNPDDATAHQWYSEDLTARGRVAESVAEAKRAQAIDPVSAEAAWDIGLALFFGGRRGEAIEQFKSAIDLNPQLWLTHSFLAWAYADGGDYDRAFAEYAKARALNDNTDILSNLTWTYAKAGRRTEALQTLETMLKRSKTEYVSPFYIGVAYYSVGDRDRAFAWLEKAYAERAELLVFINVAPIFAPLHDDPRFVDLVRRIGVSR